MLAETLTNGPLTLMFWAAVLLLGMVGSLAIYRDFRQKLREVLDQELDTHRSFR